MRSAAVLGSLLALAVAPVLAQLPSGAQGQFDDAARRIARLPPTAFPELPPDVIRELQRRGCTVPQTPSTNKPHNVVKGQFARRGQIDWAVLCSVNGTSRILVFWNGSGKNPAEVATMEDRIFMQDIGDGRIAYSRRISPAGNAFILRHYHAYGGPKPPPIDHQGIDDAFLEKASVIWYWHDGKWLKLTGAD